MISWNKLYRLNVERLGFPAHTKVRRVSDEFGLTRTDTEATGIEHILVEPVDVDSYVFTVTEDMLREA